MNSIMRTYADWIIRNRISVIVVIGILTLFLSSRLVSLKLDNDLDLWAPQNHPFIKTTRLLERVFGGRNFTIIGIAPKSGDIYQPAVLEKVQNIQRGMENIPEAVRRNIISLAAGKTKAITGMPDGMEVRRMMETVPRSPAEIARLKADLARNPIFSKAIASPDGRMVAIIADFKINKENPNYTPLYQSIMKVVDKERDGLVDIYAGGLPVDLAMLEHYMMQMPIYFGFAFLIIMLIQYWSFRSFQGMLLPSVTALLSVLWSLGVMGMRGVHLDAMNMNTPILIMAVTAGHSIQILKRYYEEYRRLSGLKQPGSDARELNDAAIVESIVRVGPIMITAAVIAVIVFYSLELSHIAMIRHFGELAASGIVAGLILEMTFIPSLRSFIAAPKSRLLASENRMSVIDRALVSLSDLIMGRKAVIVLAIAAGVILLVFSGVLRLRQDNSLKQYFARNSQLRQDDAVLNKALGGTNSILFLVEGKGSDSIKDPRVLRGMVALQSFLDGQPHVGKTQSIADLIRRMNSAMHNDDPAHDGIPDSRELIAQSLLLYSLSGEPQDFDNFVDNDYQKAMILVYLKTDSTSYAKDLYARSKVVIAENFPPDISVRIGGSIPQTTAINEVMIEEKFNNIFQMGIVLFLLSSLILRSFVGGLFVVTPLVTVVMANFGFMGWAGISLDLVTAVTASMAIAIGADYELYLMFRLKEELARAHDLHAAVRDSFLTSGKAIILAALSVAGGYTVLLTSDFGFYIRFSVVVIVTMVVSALSTIVILRSMMMIFKPRFIFGSHREITTGSAPLPKGEAL